MISITGSTVKLTVNKANGVDDFNAPIYTETEVDVENVLIEPASNDAITSEYDMYGKHLAYVLHIPKGDTHDWKDTTVKLPTPWNINLRTYGDCLIYDPNNTPFAWNKKVKAEIYE